MMPTAHKRMLFLFLAALSVASIALASATGSVNLDWGQWTTALTDPRSEHGELVWRLRIPRATAAWAVGALLSLSGCLMQVLLRNPLADPYILGVSGGASFATLLGMTLGVASAYLPALAWAGALASILIVFSLARGEGPWSGTRLLLTGVVTASGWAALISLLLTLGPDSSLRGMLFWLIGDLSYSSLPSWALVTLAFIFLVCFGMARSLNVLAMGETTARLLGEPTHKLLWLVYLLASVLTATAVSIAGTVLAPRQLPVGVVTALLGVPLFLLLLNKARVRQ
jgi:iron complex transport system permease protein